MSEIVTERADARPLKLFVVGESSGDPDKWCELGRRELVVARDEAEAVSLTEFGGPCCEVQPSRPLILYRDIRTRNPE